MLIKVKEEKYVDDSGVERLRTYYGKDKNHIVAKVESIAQKENETTEPMISEQEELNAEILLNQASIIAKQEEQDEVLAEILLNQVKGGD